MNLLLYINNINLSQIYFLDKKKNIIMDGVFTKIVYSNNCMSMNGIYIDFPIKNIMTNRIHSKNILQLDTISNKDLFQKLFDIEKQLLSYYIQYFSPSHSDFQTSEKYNHTQNKNIVYTLKNQLQTGFIKYYKEYECSSKPYSLYIKISGIWENQNDIGITFKIIEYQKQT